MFTMTMTENGQRKSILTVAMIMCAALYAVGSFATAYIPSPWGFGQFRPAVVIPAFFAAIFGPMPAGIGAAMGTLIADSVKHGYLYPGSYLAVDDLRFMGLFYRIGDCITIKSSTENKSKRDEYPPRLLHCDKTETIFLLDYPYPKV